MPHVTVEWENVPYNELIDSCPCCDLYLMARGVNLEYIGKAYDQDVSDEIKNSLRRLDTDPKFLSFWTGSIFLYKSTFDRKSHDLVLDIESLLIFTHQPTKNIQSKKSYNGRPHLIVKNSGCTKWLRPTIRVVGGTVYQS